MISDKHQLQYTIRGSLGNSSLWLRPQGVLVFYFEMYMIIRFRNIGDHPEVPNWIDKQSDTLKSID